MAPAFLAALSHQRIRRAETTNSDVVSPPSVNVAGFAAAIAILASVILGKLSTNVFNIGPVVQVDLESSVFLFQDTSASKHIYLIV